MTREEICTYEVSKLAKEKGFNEKCYHYYQNGVLESDECFNRYNKGVDSVCSAPTQSLLQRWLREEKKMYVCPFIITDYEDDFHPYVVYWSFVIVNVESGDSLYREYERIDEKRFDTYEHALEDAELYCLKNLL